ncbi:MAG: SDR family oxidoreductase [Deltaproteobacteria bacterium]|nr:SDR family oxidoreductase [Deltaproteobacteria bacterium]
MAFQVLVTGGAGFIGSHLAQRLLELGHRVVILDDFSSGRPEKLTPLQDAGGERLRVIPGDILDPQPLAEAMRGTTHVLHQAAIASVARSLEQPVEVTRANVIGTLKVLEAARDARVRRVVVASSSSVYGDGVSLPVREEAEPAPISPYGVSKLAAELYARLFHQLYGLETVALRYFNVFGPRQDPASEYAAVIPRFITAVLRHQPPVVHGDGEQTRDFTYVENVVQANLLALEAPGASGEVFNIGCGTAVSLNELLAALRLLTGRPIQPTHGPPRPGDIRHSLADITRARRLLGYQPAVSFREGLARTLDAFRKTLE